MTDALFHIPSIKLAESQSKHQKNTYMYLFNFKNPFEGGRYGAMHGFEIAFVFGYFWDDFFWFFPKKTAETELLSDKMTKAWTSFAKTGNPNHSDIPKWPFYNHEKRSTIIFDKEIEIWDDPLSKEREMWYNTKTWSQF
jgi:para-nitrobenzyl esterase